MDSSSAKKRLVTLITNELTPTGFARFGKTWIRHNQEITGALNLQKSNFGFQYYFNLAFNISKLSSGDVTKVEQFHVWLRADYLSNFDGPTIAELLNFESSDMPVDKRFNEIRVFLQSRVVSFLNTGMELDGLRKIAADHKSIAVRLRAREYLGIAS